MRVRISLQARIKNCIGNLICNFVGMPFRNGLRRKNMTMLFIHVAYYIIIRQSDREAKA